MKNLAEILKEIIALSPHDRRRLLQCCYCIHDSRTCGGSEAHEDRNGMCKMHRDRRNTQNGDRYIKNHKR